MLKISGFFCIRDGIKFFAFFRIFLKTVNPITFVSDNNSEVFEKLVVYLKLNYGLYFTKTQQ